MANVWRIELPVYLYGLIYDKETGKQLYYAIKTFI